MSKIQEIFRSRKSDLENMPLNKLKTIDNILTCRTRALGGIKTTCNECGHEYFSYRSCGHRNCPQCQSMKQISWVSRRKDEMLDVAYFHSVFTVPSELNELFLAHPKEMFNILFKAVSQTLFTLSSDSKWLGCKPGFVSVLHTWGSNLSFHPHVHVLIAGCGINDKGMTIVSKRKKYFIPVKMLSRVFRGIFLNLLSEHSYVFDRKLYDEEWVVFCKDTIDCAGKVVEYIGRYIYKAAITDSRIVDFDDKKVSFTYKDYKDKSKVKTMALDTYEFCRRFLMHVLPAGFRKVRFCGFLANKNKNVALDKMRRDLKQKKNSTEFKKMTAGELAKVMFGKDYTVCPKCKSSNITQTVIDPLSVYCRRIR